MKDDVQVSDKPFAFGPNPLRLSLLECGLVILLVSIAWIVLPPLWSRLRAMSAQKLWMKKMGCVRFMPILWLGYTIGVLAL